MLLIRSVAVTSSVLTKENVSELWKAQKQWLEMLNKLSETFSGEKLLIRQENLHEVETCMNKWNEMALFILKSRIDPSSLQLESVTDQLQSVTSLVSKIEDYMKHLSFRTSGENGK